MKQPAYAKRLVEQRRAGMHPKRVVVLYGNDWRIEDGVTRLAAKPGEARELSWAAVAGLPVRVIDRAREDEDLPDAQGWCELHFLLGDIAAWAATLHVTSDRFDLQLMDAAELAFVSRIIDPALRKCRWPAWWSDDIQRIHEKNADRWIFEISTAILAA